MRKRVNYFVIVMSVLFWIIFPIKIQADDYQLQATPQLVNAQRFKVVDFNVIDGDTSHFVIEYNEEVVLKVRFLLIDAPEIKGGVPYSKAAKKRVNELLEGASTIEIEYEGNRIDRYGRELVHVWIDGKLLQEILVSEGYAISRYIHHYLPNSPYATIIYDAQAHAKYYGKNIWIDGDKEFLEKAEYPEQWSDEIYYRNCNEVKAAGKAPIKKDDPGFRPQFDGDNDGIGCER